MKLSIKYFLYIGFLHVFLLTLNIVFLRDRPWLFLLAELVLIISLYIAWKLYRSFIVPIQLLAAGAESLKEKDFSIQFNPVGQQEMDVLIEVYNKMIEQLRQERAQQEERNNLLQKVISASPAGIMLLDLEGRISTINPAAQRIFEQEIGHLLGMLLESLTPPFGKELASLPPDQVVVIQAKGTRFYRCVKSKFVDRGFERQFLMIEELTNEILKTEKQAYDKVIRMMSHEVNNSICAINSILQSFADVHPEEEGFHEAVEIAMNRNHRLVKFMSNFADVIKVPSPSLKLVNANLLIKDLSRLMEADCKKRQVTLELNYEDEDLKVVLDVVQFEQVMVNVMKNALESVEKGGKIIISLNSQGLKVLDNGKGISPEVQKKLFSPFYSTKPQGQGIGLMLVREILHNHHFPFSLNTRPDGWTEFSILWKQQEIVNQN